jgi:hypothetical protein
MRDIAWAAGVYEGEGSCQKAGGKGRYTTEVVRIGQKDSWLCERLRALFGGSVRLVKAHTSRSGIKRRDFYTWLLTGARARGFLLTVFTFLSTRRRAQIAAVLA